MSIILTIILVGAIQGFILSFFFYIKGNLLTNKLFGSVLLIISTALLLAYLQNVIDFKSYPFLIKLSMPFSLIFMPLLLIYLQKLTGRKKVNYLVFMPALILIAYNLPFYFGSEAMKIDYFIRNEQSGKPLMIEKLEGIFIEFCVVAFSLQAVFEAKKYKQNLKAIYSNPVMGKSSWVQFIAFVMLLLSFLALLLSVLALFTDKVPVEFNFITAIGSTMVIYIVAYYLLSYPHVFTNVVLANQRIEDSKAIEKSKAVEAPKSLDKSGTVEKDKTIEASKIVEDKKELLLFDLKGKIIESLESEKLYLKPNLTLNELANTSGVPSYLVSKVINEYLKTNFFALINGYRLQHAQQHLLQKKKKTIIEIAYEAGFNSKTTFYETFKKETGVSPTQFIKEHQKRTILEEK